MVTIGLDGAFETLLGLFVPPHHELRNSDLVEHGRIPRRDFQRGLVKVHRVEIVLILAQFVATFFQFLGRCPGSGRVDAVQRRRSDFHLFGILSLQWENEKRSEEKRHGADADTGKHIHPRPNIQNFTVSSPASVLRCFPCKFEAAKPVVSGASSLHFAATAAVCRCYYSLDGPDASLSFFWEPLSPLNTPTNLPKKPFFFFLLSSSDWTPPAASVFPPAVGGGSAFSEFPPNIREKKPCALLFWSQVSRGSVPATKAIV